MTNHIIRPKSRRRARTTAWLAAGALCLAPLAATVPATAAPAPAVDRIDSGNASCAIGYTGTVTIGYHGGFSDPDAEIRDVIGTNMRFEAVHVSLANGPGSLASAPGWRFDIGKGAHATAADAAVFPLEGEMYLDPKAGVLAQPLPPDPRLPERPEDQIQFVDNLSVRVEGTKLTMTGDLKVTKRGDYHGEGAALVESGATIATSTLEKPFNFDVADGAAVKLTTLLAMNTGTMVPGAATYLHRYPLIGPVIAIEATADRDCTLKDEGPVDPGYHMPTTGIDGKDKDKDKDQDTGTGTGGETQKSPLGIVALVMTVLGVFGGLAGLLWPRFGFFR